MIRKEARKKRKRNSLVYLEHVRRSVHRVSFISNSIKLSRRGKFNRFGAATRFESSFESRFLFKNRWNFDPAMMLLRALSQNAQGRIFYFVLNKRNSFEKFSTFQGESYFQTSSLEFSYLIVKRRTKWKTFMLQN